MVAPSGRPISTVPASPSGTVERRAVPERCSGRMHTVTRSPTAAGTAGARALMSAPMSSATVASPFSATRLAGQHVGGADEGVDEQRARRVVDFRRRAELLEPALVEHGDAVGHGQRLFLVVRHQDGGGAGEALDALDLDLHVEAQVLVERRERLVEQQDARLDGERAGERDALLLAAGELLGIAVGDVLELDQRQHLGNARRLVGLGHAARRQARTRCSRRPSCAETARSSGTRCRPRAGWAAVRRSRSRRPPPAPRSAR